MINGIVHLNKMNLAPRRDESHAAIQEMLFPSSPPPKLIRYES
jgi:hypothetical protein